MRQYKFILIFFLSVIGIPFTFSQDWLGYSTGNYAGINSIHLQPANIVDSRFSVDVNIIGTDFSFGNNYYYMKYDFVKQFQKMSIDSIFNLDNFEELFLYESLNGKPKNGIINLNVQGPSVLVNLTEKDAVGLFTRFRTMINIDDADEPLAKSIREGFDDKNYWNKRYLDDNVELQYNSWAEYGLSYGRVLYNQGEHFLKAGINIKVLQGLASAYLFVKNLDYKLNSSDSFSVYKTNISYGHSDNLAFSYDTVSQSPNLPDLQYKFVANPTLGFDFGLVYEYRPDYQEHKFNMDGKTDLWRKDENKYKLKIGISVLDLGSMKYKKSPNTGNFFMDTMNMRFSAWNKVLGTTDLDTFLNRQNPKNIKLEHESGDYRMSLPTALSFQIDFNIFKGLYFNFTPYISLKGHKDQTKTHYWSTYTLTPRWESQWFGIYLPISYNTLMATNVGLSLRLGPLILGTSDIFGYWVGKPKMGGLDLYFALKCSIPYGRVKDRDEDGVSNRKDRCPDVPGTWEFRGCPDTDGDHVQDKYDSCINTPGLAEFHGCPDSDGDGIPDKQDSCPYLAGPAFAHGCPDSDNDSVPDYIDQCPNKAGPRDNHGCPYPDRDKDGVPDKFDKCPDVPGTIANHGCPEIKKPVIKKAEKEIIKVAFENLEFETGKAIISKSSYKSLLELAKLLLKKTDWELSIEGHTDNVGDRPSNIILSKKRAEAVADFLVQAGVDIDKLTTSGYGPDKPIADNKTPQGRQKNRRVEMKVLVNGKPISEQPEKEVKKPETKTETKKKELPAVAEKGWNFYVIVGSFKDKENAKKAVAQWKEKGFTVSVVYSKTKETYYISAGKFMIKTDADDLKKELKGKDIESWINYLESL